jgi:hypothetical protein
MTNLDTLREIVEHALEVYSEEKYSAKRMYGVETEVLTGVMQDNTKITNYFRRYQLNAMEDLIGQGYWLAYNQEHDCMMLSRDPIFYKYWNHDWDSVTNGAD